MAGLGGAGESPPRATIQMKLSMLLMRMVKDLFLFLNNIMLKSAFEREN